MGRVIEYPNIPSVSAGSALAGFVCRKLAVADAARSGVG